MSESGSDAGTPTASTGGVRAELEVDARGSCPLAAASAQLEGDARSMSRAPTDDGTVVEQFTVEEPEGELDDVDADPVFDYADRRVYQVTRPEGDCVCELIEELDCPVADVRATDGRLRVTLHLLDASRLREVVGELRENFDGVRVRYLGRDDPEREGEDLVPVDRGQLTDRQHEVLTTAYEMGYFEYPREANASEVAEALDVGLSTAIEHLTTAQSKVLSDLLETADR